MPKPRGRHFNQTINTNTQDLVCNPSPTSSSGPLTPKDKTVKAIFASPKITQTAAGKRERKKYRKRACADRQIVDTAVGGGDDDYGGEIVDGRDEEEEVCFERRGTEVGQVQPDSAIDVSFPGAGEVSPTAKMKKKIARSRKVKKTDGGVTTIHKEKSGAAAEASATRAEEGMDKPPPKKRTRRSTRNSGVAGSGA